MSDGVVRTLYFSPTGSTKKIISQISRSLAERLQRNRVALDLARPQNRQTPLHCDEQDILLLGLPVYGDGLPAPAVSYLKQMTGGCAAVAVAVYGNRSYGHALVDMQGLLQAAGCTVFAAAAFVGQHSYTAQVASERPDWQDVALIGDFAYRVADKFAAGELAALSLPADAAGAPLAVDKATAEGYYQCHPQTNDDCNNCGFCADICPVGAIDAQDPRLVSAACLRCCACVKRCLRQAKSFDHPHFQAISQWLEANCQSRREPQLFL